MMNKLEEGQEKSPPRRMCSRKNMLWFLAFISVIIGMVISYLSIRNIHPLSNQDLSNQTSGGMDSKSFNGSSSISYPVWDQTDISASEPSEAIPEESYSVCQTEECNYTAELFLSSMNTSVDPCDDFYEFACGNFELYSEGLSQDQVTWKRISNRLIELMELADENDSIDLLQFKYLYQTCVDMGDIREEFWNAAQLVEDYPEAHTTLFKLFALTDPATEERKMKCLELLETSSMSLTITREYILRDITNGTIDEAWETQAFITSAFQALIANLDWMDRVTKRQVIGKAQDMEIHLGYPDAWLQDPEILSECYEGLEFTDGTFAENFLAAQIWDQWWRDNELTSNRCLEKAIWDYSTLFLPSLTNGYHERGINAVIIGIGYLQQPYFGLGVRAADYGSLGNTLAHELVHGFDARDALPWNASYVSERVYNAAAECLTDQYEKYLSMDHGMEVENGLTWNPASTLKEDVSDIGGLEVAYQAYKLYLAQRGVQEPRLPGLENYSQEQVFFLSYAQYFCSPRNQSTSVQDDTHSPAKYRVIGPLSNFPEFANTRQCPKSSRMNPDKKCVLWR